MEDWQEFCYVDILKYETPWRIRSKVAGWQQAGSQSVRAIPLFEALDNMLLYMEDQKHGKDHKIPSGLRLLLSRLPSTLRFLHPRLWRKQDTHYVFVYRTVIVREASRTP